MVTISENLKAIGEKLYEISRKQTLAQTQTDAKGRTPTHIWVTGNHSKSRCPPRPKGGVHNVWDDLGLPYSHWQKASLLGGLPASRTCRVWTLHGYNFFLQTQVSCDSIWCRLCNWYMYLILSGTYIGISLRFSLYQHNIPELFLFLLWMVSRLTYSR